jgi:hypothetical protein
VRLQTENNAAFHEPNKGRCGTFNLGRDAQREPEPQEAAATSKRKRCRVSYRHFNGSLILIYGPFTAVVSRKLVAFPPAGFGIKKMYPGIWFFERGLYPNPNNALLL